jgi:hypothetical protein
MYEVHRDQYLPYLPCNVHRQCLASLCMSDSELGLVVHVILVFGRAVYGLVFFSSLNGEPRKFFCLACMRSAQDNAETES